MIIDENPECNRKVDKESSLVIATITERKADLSELLQRITHQIVKPHEVVVVCDGHISGLISDNIHVLLALFLYA